MHLCQGRLPSSLLSMLPSLGNGITLHACDPFVACAALAGSFRGSLAPRSFYASACALCNVILIAHYYSRSMLFPYLLLLLLILFTALLLRLCYFLFIAPFPHSIYWCWCHNIYCTSITVAAMLFISLLVKCYMYIYYAFRRNR